MYQGGGGSGENGCCRKTFLMSTIHSQPESGVFIVSMNTYFIPPHQTYHFTHFGEGVNAQAAVALYSFALHASRHHPCDSLRSKINHLQRQIKDIYRAQSLSTSYHMCVFLFGGGMNCASC